jgi:hypothetical protein
LEVTGFVLDVGFLTDCGMHPARFDGRQSNSGREAVGVKTGGA